MNLLCIDVGNTETKLGAFDASGAMIGTWRVTTARRRTADEYGVLFAAFFSAAHFPVEQIAAIIVSSVVPVVDRPLAEGCKKYFGVRATFFSAAKQDTMVVRTDRPREVGSDLIAAAIGAVEFVGTPAIAINFGTATTFDCVSAKGEYLGGVICPGIGISADALFQRTARLPRVDRC